MRVRCFVVVLLAGIAAVGVLAFRRPPQPRPDGPRKLEVAATIFPLADWLREVGGPDVEVHCLVSGGKNPHHFEPAIGDAVVVARARALFAAGLGLDEWAERLAANSGRGAELAFFETGSWIAPRAFQAGQTGVVPLPAGEGAPGPAAPHRAEGVEVEAVHEHAHGNWDPHYWLDPLRASTVVVRMAGELGKLDPVHRDGYQQRCAAYVEKLKALNDEVAALARATPSGAQLVTFHDAYGYLLERLGIGLPAVIQSSPGVEPSVRDVGAALRILKQTGQRAVFHEPADSGVAVQTIARELGLEVEVLDPLDTEASSAGKTYLERVRHDLKVLAGAVRK
ncbi:MAG: metal ABC transporter substrate-binding protein [Planctomycetota bacterium]